MQSRQQEKLLNQTVADLKSKNEELTAQVDKSCVDAVDKAKAAQKKAEDNYDTLKKNTDDKLEKKNDTIKELKGIVKNARKNERISIENSWRSLLLPLMLVLIALVKCYDNFYSDVSYPIDIALNDYQYILGGAIVCIPLIPLGCWYIKRKSILSTFVLILSLYLGIILSDLLSPTGTYLVLIGVPVLYWMLCIFDEKGKFKKIRENFVFKSRVQLEKDEAADFD